MQSCNEGAQEDLHGQITVQNVQMIIHNSSFEIYDNVQVRAPMGVHKRIHIQRICQLPEVKGR